MKPIKLLSFSVMILAILCLGQANPAPEIPQIAQFEIDLISGEVQDPASGWWSISGEPANFHWVDITNSLDPSEEEPNSQLWTFKLITSEQEVPPGLPEFPNYEVAAIDLGTPPEFPSFSGLFFGILDPLDRYVYYPTEVDPPGDDIRSYFGIVLGKYKIDPGEVPGEGSFIYITCLLTNNVTVWQNNEDQTVATIDAGAGPIGITTSDNPAHIAQTVLNEAIMVEGVTPDDNCELSCDENQTDCRRRVRMERKACRAKCRLDLDPRPCLRDCLLKAKEAMRQCRKGVEQICAESCSLSLKQVESLYLGEEGEPITITALSSEAFFNFDTSALFDKTILNIMERKGQVEMDYPELLSFEDSKTFVLERDYQEESGWEMWYEKTLKGEIEYKPVTLNYHDAEGNERTIDGMALPIWYEKSDGEVPGPVPAPPSVKETIELLVGRIEYK